MGKKHIAIDLGASNGRVIVGNLENLEIIHRFVTRNIKIKESLYWNFFEIYSEILVGLKKAFEKYPDDIDSIGIDCWGVDYSLIDEKGTLVSPIYHYRDNRTKKIIDEVNEKVGGKSNLFLNTGIAYQPFNTVYQLYSHKKEHPESFNAAKHYLALPDLLTFWLTGKLINERTHASTTQLYDTEKKDWSWKIIERLDLPKSLFGKIVDSGTIVGSLTKNLIEMFNLRHDVVVVAVGSHDTASAVAATPHVDNSIPLYLSSGTWSLLGVEIDEPLINEKVMNSGFTNEIAFNGKVRFLQNIMGMWIQQECIRCWEKEGYKLDFKVLDQETIDEKDYPGYINPQEEIFLAPSNANSTMISRVAENCKKFGFEPPITKGQYMVAIYRGLALSYSKAIKVLEEIHNVKFDTLHILGGGAKNKIVNQWTSDYCKIEVTSGPIEATALGNILVQMLALDEIKTIKEGRFLIKKFYNIKRYFPKNN